MYTGVTGANVVDLTNAASYRAGQYSSRALLTSSEAPSSAGDNYGQRLRGYITAPTTGDYTLYVCSDDTADLYVGTGVSKFTKRLVARCVLPTAARQWTSRKEQASPTLSLVAGQKYYIEVLHKENTGSDSLSLGWKKPGSTTVEAIPTSALSSFAITSEDADDDDLPDTWEQQYGLSTTDRGAINPANGPWGDPDGDGVLNWMEWVGGTSPINAMSDGVTPDSQGLRGFLRRERWNNISGNEITDLTSSPIFRQAPTSVEFMPSADSLVNSADNFGERLRGRLIAPVSGQYNFWISGDETCELWLSTTASKFQRTKIATVSTKTAYRSYATSTSQASAAITLQAGQEYYIEVLHKEGTGNDSVSVAWSYTGQSQQVIPGNYLRSYQADPNDVDDDGLPDSWEVSVGLNPADNGSISSNDGSYADPDGDGFNNFAEYLSQGDPFHKGGNIGFLQGDVWNLTTSTGQLADLTTSGVIARTPDESGYNAGAEAPMNRKDNFGFRMRGIVTAPVTGNYQFAIAGDQVAELWVSDSESRFRKRRVAYTGSFTSSRQFTKYPTQLSAAIPLEAGHRYYIEALQVESTGSDNLAVGWSYPGQALSVIGAQYLSVPYPQAGDADGDNLPDAWEQQYGLNPNDNGSVNPSNGEFGDPDGDGIGNFAEFAAGTNPMVSGEVPGVMERQMWLSIGGSAVSDLIKSPKFLQRPDIWDTIPGAEAPENIGYSYGQRLRASVIAPVTGDYVFAISGDDSGELWVSSDDRKFHKEKVAWFGDASFTDSGTTEPREWNKYVSQKSRPIRLIAGQSYFIEVLHKESTSHDHVSIGWEYQDLATGQITPTQVLPASALRSFGKDIDDQDDDYLPDAWELQYGFSSSDNGAVNPNFGEHGDPDHDGLTNQEEYQLGTNPLVADTDGDGVNDYTEVTKYGSNPLVADVTPGTPVGTFTGTSISGQSSSWYGADENTLVSTARRGWVEYAFSVNGDGRFMLSLDGVIRGTVAAGDSMPLVISVDGTQVGRVDFVGSATGVGTVSSLLPWLNAGSHVLRVFSENTYGDRSLQINAIRVETLAGVDADNNGVVDWIEEGLDRENNILSSGASAVSPFCLEGHATYPTLVTVISGDNAAIFANEGVQNHWYKDVELSADQSVPVTVSFENGGMVRSTTLTWTPTNLLQSGAITLRKGDSLRLTAYPGQSPNPAAQVQLVMGQTTTQTTPDAPLVQKFEQAGDYTITGRHTLNGVVTEATVVVKVLEASFGPAFPVYMGRPRVWNLPTVPSQVFVEKDPRLFLYSQNTVIGKAYQVDARETGDLNVLARIGNGGPILAKGTLMVVTVASSATTSDATVVYTFDNGDRLVRMGVVADDLPPGGYLQLDIVVAGVTFQDGTRRLTLRASDFDANGIAYVVFNYPAGVTTSVCHKLSIYDANGVLVGVR